MESLKHVVLYTLLGCNFWFPNHQYIPPHPPKRKSCSLPSLTPTNTGLDPWNDYPELGSMFKAAQVKTLIWGMAKKLKEVVSRVQELLCKQSGIPQSLLSSLSSLSRSLTLTLTHSLTHSLSLSLFHSLSLSFALSRSLSFWLSCCAPG